MLKEGIIEPRNGAWSSAPVIVRKKDGKYRFCVDFRDVNARIVKDRYQIPSIDDVLDDLRNAMYISKIDLTWSFHQIEIDEECRDVFGFFVEGMGFFRFKRMAFGGTNSPATLQRLVELLFPRWWPVRAYLDDIIVFTATFKDHVYWLLQVLRTLVKANIHVNLEKSEFCVQEVTYLGYLLDKDGLRPDLEKVKPVLLYPKPTNLKELRSFLGMVGWYARFIQNAAELKIPLCRLLRKNEPFVWSEEQEKSMTAVKKPLCEAPVLARPDFSKDFTLHCEASDFAIGAVLTQEDENGHEHPIMFFSQTLTPAERQYSVTERECLAVVRGIKKSRPYIEGGFVTVVTDHYSLK